PSNCRHPTLGGAKSKENLFVLLLVSHPYFGKWNGTSATLHLSLQPALTNAGVSSSFSVWTCSRTIAVMTKLPPNIWSRSRVSPKKKKAMKPAEIGSMVDAIVARVDRIWFTPTKNRPKGMIVPKTAMYNMYIHCTQV